jgi:DNA-binding NarL/FixJ family response regulator
MTSTRPSTMIAAREPELRALVRLALEPVAECWEADGPAAAVDIAARLHPDVCFVDAEQNGNGSAIRTLELIREAHPEARIVLLRGSDSEAEFIRALRAGADGYLPRTIDPTRLPQIVEALLRGEPAIPRLLVTRLVDELRHLGRRQITTSDSRIVDLTRREAEVLDLVREGRPTHAIAHRLGIADVTVRRHRAALFAKLGVNTNAELLRLLETA